MQRILIVLLGLALAGCKTPPIGVQHVSSHTAYEQINANVLVGETPSDATVVVLHRLMLTEEFKWYPARALASLHERACKDKNRDILFALAELNYLTGQRLNAQRLTASSPKKQSERPLPGNPQPYYLASTLYSYLYLFGDGEDAPSDPFDRRFRVACDLYNRALEKALSSGNGIELNLAGGVRQIPNGSLRVQFDGSHFRWPIEWIDRVLPADRFKVRGLSHRDRTSGLGAPLILVPKVEAVQTHLPKYMAGSNGKLKAPATAFLRLHGNICDLGTDRFHASLELHSVTDNPQTVVNGRSIPLEIDLTAALAHSLQQSQVWSLDYKQLLSGEQRVPSGTYLLQPYQPGKIPVVFVHGTASNPAYWTEMINTLMADPKTREQYQFMFFIYNTGNPILYSASLLRDSLNGLVKELDPEEKDESLKKMVVIGHSQGGLLSRLIASSSGERFWRNVSDEPFDKFNMPEKDRDLLRKALFFEPLPFVRRVVFIATPHGGSYQVGNLLERLAMRFITLSQTLNGLRQDFSGESIPPQLRKGIPNSIANMRPNSPFAKALGDIWWPPSIKAHSIIAVKGDGPPEKGNDGVVAYVSAHIENVESEFVVRSAHSCQQNPKTIEEIRRILLLHSQQLKTE